MAAPDALSLPTALGLIDGIELVEQTGSRGAVAVFAARDLASGEPLVVELAPTDTPSAGRVRAAARVLERVRHPNLAALFGAGDVAGKTYLATASGPAIPLPLARRPLAWPRVVAIGLGVARALGALHRAGVVHGAPDAWHVVVDDGRRVVLGGLSEAVDAGGRVAPELRAGGVPTMASDLWALGDLLQELLSPTRVVALEDSAPTTADPRPGVPLEFVELVQRCIAIAPADRPRSIGVVIDALDRMMIHVPTGGASSGGPVLDAAAILRVQASLARVARAAAGFSETVHEGVVARLPGFATAGDAARAHRRLFGALHVAIAHLDATERFDDFLLDLGMRYGLEGTRADRMAATGDALFAALARHDAERWTPALANAWRSVWDAIVVRLAAGAAR